MTDLTQFVSILAQSALATPVTNKIKASQPLEFYARIAFPPEAIAALMEMVQAAAGAAFGGLHPDVQHGITTNATATKPIPGIPGDWLLVRVASQYAPYVADAAGKQLPQVDPAAQGVIKTTFYPGKRVRAAISAFTWTHKTGGRGISYNLDGIMATATDSDRLNIGTGVVANVFQQFAQAQAAAPTFAQAQAAPAQVAAFAAPTANPFGAAAPADSANPFAQAQTQANPFA
jgi:hypothetical protein